MPGINLMINSTIDNFNLKNTTYDNSNLLFEIHKEKPQIKVSLNNISFDFEFNYNITSDPELISEVGLGTVKVRNLDI